MMDRKQINHGSGGIQGLDQLSHVMPIESEQSDERWQLKKQQSGNAVTRRSQKQTMKTELLTKSGRSTDHLSKHID